MGSHIGSKKPIEQRRKERRKKNKEARKARRVNNKIERGIQ